ncbi:MAG: hypothetical protein LBL46_02990 [Rickettsiales bacterium]|jgi:hypothetical protein|nr:hypothetical protein [Rickettsiales bacterium]
MESNMEKNGIFHPLLIFALTLLMMVCPVYDYVGIEISLFPKVVLWLLLAGVAMGLLLSLLYGKNERLFNFGTNVGVFVLITALILFCINVAAAL